LKVLEALERKRDGMTTPGDAKMTILNWPWPSLTTVRVLSISAGWRPRTVTPGSTGFRLSLTYAAGEELWANDIAGNQDEQRRRSSDARSAFRERTHDTHLQREAGKQTDRNALKWKRR